MSRKVSIELWLARCRLWWARNDGYVYIVVFGILCALAGAGSMSLAYQGVLADAQTERLEMLRQHDDEIRDFRMSCRRVVDERDEKVKQATDAAANAADAAANAADAAAKAKP